MPESVWDYPRPPALSPENRRLRVVQGGKTIAETTGGFAVKETSHPPTFYFPPDDILPGMLDPGGRRSICEFKGAAVYWSVGGVPDAAWSYPVPTPAFAAIRDQVAFYPSLVDSCWVGDEQVAAQEGDFLRRLDHQRRQRSVQGCARDFRLVSPAGIRYPTTDRIGCTARQGEPGHVQDT